MNVLQYVINMSIEKEKNVFFLNKDEMPPISWYVSEFGTYFHFSNIGSDVFRTVMKLSTKNLKVFPNISIGNFEFYECHAEYWRRMNDETIMFLKFNDYSLVKKKFIKKYGGLFCPINGHQ